MKLLKAILLVPVLLVFLTGAALAKTAPKQRAGLDRSFGRHGKVVLSAQTTGAGGTELLMNGSDALDHQAGFATKILPLGKGRLLVASGPRLFRFEANGKLDPGFGDGGVLEVQGPAGQILMPRSVAIDPQGRILIAGEAENLGASPEPLPNAGPFTFPGMHGPLPIRAAVLRLLADGKPDPSFGSGGIVESTFGAPPPSNSSGGAYATPVAQGTAITSDSEGHPILAGDFVTQSILCYPFTSSTFETQGFVARLGTNGAVKTVSTDPTVASSRFAGSLSTSGGNQFLFLGWQGGHCMRAAFAEPSFSVTTFLDAFGNAVAGTSPASVESTGPATAAVDSKGRAILSYNSMKDNVEGLAVPHLTRLNPNGAPDPSFGSQGTRALPHLFQTSQFRQEPAAVSVDASNRPVLLGMASDYEVSTGFNLVRLTARGAIDKRFGKDGNVTIPFPPAGHPGTVAVMVDGRGRIVLAGRVQIGSAEGEQIEIARYRPAH